jgi:hypothetical protein
MAHGFRGLPEKFDAFDHSVDYATAPAYYERIGPPRFLLGLTGVGHSEAVESQIDPPIPARAAAQRASIAFLNAAFQHASAAFDAPLAALAATGDIVRSDPTTRHRRPII